MACCAVPAAFKGVWLTAFETTFGININLTFVTAVEGANQKRPGVPGGFRERGVLLRTGPGRVVLDHHGRLREVMSCSNLQALCVFLSRLHMGMTESLAGPLRAQA